MIYQYSALLATASGTPENCHFTFHKKQSASADDDIDASLHVFPYLS